MSNFLNKNFVINFFIILSIFGLDRFNKVYVISENEKNLSSELFVTKFLNINLIYNEGIAFGLLSFDQSHMYNILTILIAAIILIIFFMTLKSDGLKKYSLLMIFVGDLCNLYYRIFFNFSHGFSLRLISEQLHYILLIYLYQGSFHNL